MWNKLIDLLSHLFPDSLIRGLAERVEHNLDTIGAGAWSRSLFLSAAVAIVIAVGIDLFLYWYRQENRDRFLAGWYEFLELLERIRANLRAIFHPRQVQAEEAYDRAVEMTQVMDETEETLEQMQQDLHRAVPEVPSAPSDSPEPSPAEPSPAADAASGTQEPSVNTLPRDIRPFKEEDPMAAPAPQESREAADNPGIASDDTGFAAPRRRRRERRESDE